MKPHATVELRKPPPLMARPRLATLGGGSCSSQASTPLSVIALAVSYDVGATGKMDGRRCLLIKRSIWKIQRDGGATSALA